MSTNELHPILKHGKYHYSRYSFRIAGSTFREQGQKAIRAFEYVPKKLRSVIFKREPNNPADPNAVRIYLAKIGSSKEPVFAGYVSKDYSPLVASVLDNSDKFFLEIESIEILGTFMETCGMRISFFIHDVKP